MRHWHGRRAYVPLYVKIALSYKLQVLTRINGILRINSVKHFDVICSVR